jgi:hypothetical protein
MIELRSSIKNCVVQLATFGRTLRVAAEAEESPLTESKSNPVSKIIG